MSDRAWSRVFPIAPSIGGRAWTMRKVSCAAAVLLGCCLGWSSSAEAAFCQVPSASHPTIQAAVDDGSCTEIVLAAQIFEEPVLIPRDLVLRGTSTSTSVIAGQVTVQGGTTRVTLEDLTVDATIQGVAGTVDTALQVLGGAEVTTDSVVVHNSAVDLWTIFVDGFEAGDTSTWSATVP